ncbi:hypothetical protein PTKIN_Ptkin16aG0118000 [Pterospermum kingtungense]
MGNETDRVALLALKDQLVDGSPGALISWNASLHFCEWQGVRCGRQQQRVIDLKLTGMRLGGSISPSIGNLSFLREANLSDNRLQGIIPREFGRLRRLRFLNVSHNNLQGNIPMELSNCSKLQLIDLNYNSLSGEIPFGLGNSDMRNLIGLSLSHNNLSGSIPSSLGNLSLLGDLQLEDNLLEGIIPNALGRLSSLKKLATGENNLSGAISSTIYNLSSITYIRMTGNKLYGGLAPELGIAFPDLEFFYIGENQFNGSIPRSVTNISSLKRLLKILAIHDNRLSGVLPVSVANLSTQLEYLIMAGNQISGSIPEEIGNLAKLTPASNQGSQQETSSAIKGTIGYLAPEYGMGGLSSPQGDIYSYGILLLEMITRKRPTDNFFHDRLSLHNFCKMALPEKLEEIVDFRLLQQINEKKKDGEIWECLVSFTKVGVACSVEVPTERMKIEDAITKLLAIKAKIACKELI